MKSVIHIVSFSLLIVLLLQGCKKTFVSNDNQVILFQYDYIAENDHHGFFIDRKGHIITYRNPADWLFAGDDQVYTEDQLARNLKKSSYTGITVPEEELARYEKYIRYLALSKVSAPRNTSSDGGTARFLCYEYSANTGAYRGTVIKTEGAVSSENLNFYSKRMASWLKDICNSLPEE